ncbi:hypothetical protein O6H91_23G045400 [Diphasiastrum complanatum]|uniref:Uncharacterized protein n=2 Tax=Diphasiastrum complanatum TaxID=34168 RepID=A0ACC2AAD9_DIPCM|nr:hypothetical protein O6H91_Y404900 [Diphasiastrum complanatum]KAJ7263693.1 hypothetical protein O6H91_Y404900 [Diphasiastrum complanatum]KAJ7514474.1 hypothetical protein O6H91_23G045400 [Diphasiastrum complanatum]KAJ7514475.1 hypothetical protein O6H91_23G045400 [Diphasiastrum complanatum]
MAASSSPPSWIATLFRLLWPQPQPGADDLLRSRKLLEPLPLSPATKGFVVALPLPDRPACVVYLLAAHYLSERSAADAASLVKCVAPQAVVAQIDPDNLSVLKAEQQILENPRYADVPTSPVHVVGQCFLEQRDPSSYESVAGAHVLRIIFGTNFFGHVFAAKQAAADAGSSFTYLVAPRQFDPDVDQDAGSTGNHPEAATVANAIKSFADSSQKDMSLNGRWISSKKTTGLLPDGLSLIKPSYLEEVKLLAPSIASVLRNTLSKDQEQNSLHVGNASEMDFVCPSYALPFYSLLPVLQEGLVTIPGLGSLLSSAQKVLLDVQNGTQIDEQKLAQASMFRVGMEAIRWQLNARARNPKALPPPPSQSASFDQLSYEDKCHVLLAQALQTQARNGQTVVAVLEAGSIEGVRKHWSTPVSPELAALAEGCFISLEDEEEENPLEAVESSTGGVLEKPVIVVGAGAAAAMGLTSISKLFHASPLVKIVTFKIPNLVKIGLMQVQSTAAFSIPKGVASAFKAVVPAVKAASPGKLLWISGPKASASMKSIANAERARAAASSITSAATRASLSAIRTAFYSIMRNRQGKPAGGRPWLLLGGSILTGGAMIFAGDRLESAIEALPVAPSLAQLGRGLQHLHTAANALNQMEHSQTLNRVYDALHAITGRKT